MLHMICINDPFLLTTTELFNDTKCEHMIVWSRKLKPISLAYSKINDVDWLRRFHFSNTQNLSGERSFIYIIHWY
jgi:hypothetical protein